MDFAVGCGFGVDCGNGVSRLVVCGKGSGMVRMERRTVVVVGGCRRGCRRGFLCREIVGGRLLSRSIRVVCFGDLCRGYSLLRMLSPS